MIQLPSEFRAALQSYQGPLDLLLYLIKKEEVDIIEIPVGRITEQYFTYLSLLQGIDPNACGEFLVMAANLMEIKSRSLLPTEAPLDDGEDPDDPRIELVRQLLEYKKYKERAALIEDRLDQHSRRYHRPQMTFDGLAEELGEGPLDLGEISVWDLLTAFHRIQLAIGERGPHRVVFEDRPLEEYIARITGKAEDSPRRTFLFDTLFEECENLYDAISFFLAILEMAKQRLLRFHQEEMYGPIEIVVAEATEEEDESFLSEENAGDSPAEPPAP